MQNYIYKALLAYTVISHNYHQIRFWVLFKNVNKNIDASQVKAFLGISSEKFL